MFAAIVALSTPAQAQSALDFGLAATLGGGWQIEGGDFGILSRAHAGPIQSVGGSVRLGSFVDEGQILGGAQGFIFGLTGAVRTGLLPIAELGSELNPSTVGLNLTVEATGYLATNSPLPQRGHWLGLSVLPGLRFGAGGAGYELVLGPTLFFDRNHANLRAFLGFRFETPLAKGSDGP